MRLHVALVALALLAAPLAGCIGGSGDAGPDQVPNASSDDGNGSSTNASTPAERSHVHDRWDGLDEVTLVDREVSTGGVTDVSAERTLLGNALCLLQCSAVELFTPAEGKIVPPGTERVVLNVSWEPGTLPEQVKSDEVWLGYQAANMDSPEYVDGDQVSGSNPRTFEINTSVEMADGGHAPASLWRFVLAVDSDVGSTEHGVVASMPRWMQTSRSFQVTATAYRVDGPLPVEPPHPDYWADGPSRTIWRSNGSGEATGTGWTFGGIPVEGDAPYGYANGSEHGIVPPGSRLLTMTINWTNDSPAKDQAGVDPQALYYHGLSEADISSSKWEPVVAEDGRRVFRLPVEADQVDGLYANRSRWTFGYHLWGEDTGVDEPMLGFDVRGPFHLDGSWDVTVRVWNTTEMPSRLS